MNDTQKAWMITGAATEELGYDVFTEDDLRDRYDEELDSDGEVNVAGFNFLPSNVLRECDPTAYKVGFSDFISSMYEEIDGGDRYVNQDDLESITGDLDDAVEDDMYGDKNESLVDIAIDRIKQDIDSGAIEDILMDVMGDNSDLAEMKAKWAIMKATEEKKKCKAALK